MDANLILNKIWFEKYRPKKLEDLILPDDVRNEFKICIENNDIANFMFHGPAGGGKTALAMILTSKYGVLQHPEDNLLAINGNAKSSRGINYVDNVIEPFFSTPPSGNDKYKIVFIDECDFMTQDAIHSLRNIIETVSRLYGRFIFTCNYIYKLPEPIRSRFQIYNFKAIDYNEIMKLCENILINEKVEYSIDDIDFIVSNLYPDMRQIINLLEQHSRTKKLIINREESLFADKEVRENFIKICSYISSKSSTSEVNNLIGNTIKILNENEINYDKLYHELFNHKLPGPIKIIINKYANSHGTCVVPAMHFSSLIFETVECMVKYTNLK